MNASHRRCHCAIRQRPLAVRSRVVQMAGATTSGSFRQRERLELALRNIRRTVVVAFVLHLSFSIDVLLAIVCIGC